jgi:hypothetical protein
MTQHPRVTERLLDGLSGRTAFSDGILGDLAEEFGRRAERDGNGPARRWYYREAARSAPHVLGDALRSFRRADLPHMATSVRVGLCVAVVLAFVVNLIAPDVFGVFRGMQNVGGRRWAWFIAHWLIAIPLITPIVILGGAGAAWHSTRSPIIAAAVFGLSLATGVSGLVAMLPKTSPGLGSWAAIVLLYVLVATIGGVVLVVVRRAGYRSPKPA